MGAASFREARQRLQASSHVTHPRPPSSQSPPSQSSPPQPGSAKAADSPTLANANGRKRSNDDVLADSPTTSDHSAQRRRTSSSEARFDSSPAPSPPAQPQNQAQAPSTFPPSHDGCDVEMDGTQDRDGLHLFADNLHAKNQKLLAALARARADAAAQADELAAAVAERATLRQAADAAATQIAKLQSEREGDAGKSVRLEAELKACGERAQRAEAGWTKQAGDDGRRIQELEAEVEQHKAIRAQAVLDMQQSGLDRSGLVEEVAGLRARVAETEKEGEAAAVRQAAQGEEQKVNAGVIDDLRKRLEDAEGRAAERERQVAEMRRLVGLAFVAGGGKVAE